MSGMAGMADEGDWLGRLRAEKAQRARVLRAMRDAEVRRLDRAWAVWRHKGQAAPAGDWRVWVMMAGRGFGKTRTGAEWVRGLVAGAADAPSVEAGASPAGAESSVATGGVAACAPAELRVALVGASIEEARRVMVEGRSGLLSLCPDARFEASRGCVRFASGAQAFLYSAANPEGLRGPEHHFAWADELAKWPRAKAAWDNLTMGLRLGASPRALVTTTPKPVEMLKRLIAVPGTVVTRGRTGDNPYLPDAFVEAMTAQYAGTALGRQELDGELIEDTEGALWSRDLLERGRVRAAPEMRRVVVGVDPPGSAGEGADACGIVVCGLGADGRAYVLADASVQGAAPERWARAVAEAAEAWGASRVVAEGNVGGALVENVLRAAGVGTGLRVVHAAKSKAARAEPVAALYTSGQASHAGAFPALEDEMCAMLACGGYEGPGRSPDRADALVWALTELMLGRARAAPRAWVG